MFFGRGLRAFVYLSVLALLTSCGDDDSATRPSSLPSEVADMSELEDYKCDMSLIGEIVYVNEKRKNYECDGDKWFESYKSSSSSAKSSSSVTLAIPCKTETKDNCKYGTLTDDRDGQTYKTVKIGDQWWMAENLNYAYLQPTTTFDSSSFCYNDSLEYCEKYGRLYFWSAMMDSVGLFSSNGMGCGDDRVCSPSFPIRGVCPKGWHVPEATEFETLILAIGGKVEYLGSDSISSVRLRAQSYYGTDEFGFSMLPSGYYDYPSLCYAEYCGYRFSGEGRYTGIWTATEHGGVHRKWAAFEMVDDGALSYVGKNDAQSVRCLKD